MCECEKIQSQLDELLASEISKEEVDANWEEFGMSKQGTLAVLKAYRSNKIDNLTGELRACKIKALKDEVLKAETLVDLKMSFIRLLDII